MSKRTAYLLLLLFLCLCMLNERTLRALYLWTWED